jgi:hypothetical protein
MPAFVEAYVKETKEPEMTARTQQSESANLSQQREIKKMQKPNVRVPRKRSALVLAAKRDPESK